MGAGMSTEQLEAQDASLQPFNPPLGLYPQHSAPIPTTLIMREKYFSWSGQDFTVRTSDGRLVLRADAKAFSLSDRKGERKDLGVDGPQSWRVLLPSFLPSGFVISKKKKDAILI